MNNKLKSLLAGTRALESRLGAAFESRARALVRSPAPTQPLELIELAVDEIARQVQPAGRGRYTFPFNTVRITFVAPASDDQARFDAICAGPPSIDDRVVRRLVSAGCELTSADVDLTIAFADAPAAGWTHPFHLSLARVDESSRAARPEPATPRELRVDLFVTHGTADHIAYSFAAFPVAIGRGVEVRDHRQQLLRINHFAFADIDDEVNRSVSRRHARIELDSGTRRLRLIDDNSAQGTSVIRGSRGIPVPRGSRGLVLQAGDEIVLGRARARVSIR